ncbi:NAD(P)/FAD-dependent oxidoreductase [Actinoplanes sp. NPDC049265]|uniref:NAD(P)/FAD-dependent oxidoreductase n=1 Tax=Actinoplanes sp. NPDC049265 TaxID=3363902 RepID=UPI003714C86C
MHAVHSPTTAPDRTEGRAVILGAGLAGLLATAALAPRYDVTLIERDELPDRPEHRRGLPQGHHAHVLMSSGARIVDQLLPGTVDEWIAAGAQRLGLPHGYVMLLPQGWLPRWPTDEFVISCSRALLDHVVRRRVLALPGVRLLDGTTAEGLTGDARRVTGVRTAEKVVNCDLVVDATGRGSRLTHWLAELGLAEVPQQVVDSGLRYATRLFRAPAGDFPIVNIQADPARGRPGQTAALMPIEDRRWLVTLSGTRGGEPPAGEDGFVAFAQAMRHPIVGDLIAGAEPLGPVRVTNTTANRRRRYDRVREWPEGLVALGDAVAAYNPVYGHGMSIAAKQALILRDRADQAAITAAAAEGWGHAAGSDVRFPDVRGAAPSAADRLIWRYQHRLFRTALDRPDVAAELVRVFSLNAPPARLFRPRTVLATARGPRSAPPAEPPFTAAERAVAA